MACELVSTCPFFNEQATVKPQMVALFKVRYCRSDYAECARYLIFASRGRDTVPEDLSPNDRLRALHILRSHEEVREEPSRL